MKKLLLLFCLVSSYTFADPVVSLLEHLCNAHAPSGFEDSVRAILKEEWPPYLENLSTDGLGNLVGIVSSTDSSKPRILLMAHMDEVGFIVSDISEEGFLRIDPLGDWVDQVLLAQEWVIMTPKGSVIGYSGMESVHAVSNPDEIKPFSRKQLFLDVGARSREEVQLYGIRIGSAVTPNNKFKVMSGGQRYLSKAFDDRAGLAVMTEVLKRLKGKTLPFTFLVAATVQEEPGMRGSEVIYASTTPDIVINLDISVPRDFPLYFAVKRSQPLLGGGPALFVFDGSMIPNQRLVEHVISTAKTKKIPLQFDSVENYGEDGCCLQKSGKGVPTVNIGIPVRYPHSHAGILDRIDFDKTVDLIVELMQSLNAENVAQIKYITF